MCWLLVIFCSLLLSGLSFARPSDDAETEEYKKVIERQVKEAMNELELAGRLEEQGNSTRESRGLLKKVAFLAGMRVGGLVQSSGTLAASNSLRVFGKVVNSALSVSYGNVNDLDALPDIDDGDGRPVYRPGRPIIDDEEAEIKIDTNGGIPLSTKLQETEEQLNRKIKSDFLRQHNDLVQRANANSKFLRHSEDEPKSTN